MHDSTDFILGIDLGTTNSCVAVHFDGTTEIIPDTDGFTTVPSVVHIAPDGTRTFGRQALDRRAHDPQATIHGAKRLIGRPADTDEIRDLQRYFAYTIVADERGELAVEVHGQRFSVIDISAWLLDYLRRNAEAWLERPVRRAVISVPAYFNQRQRDAVQEAGQRAGLDVLRIVNEPTAAALAYGAGKQGERRIIVYDLGGGTFDVTVLSLQDRVFEVLATGGDSFLGGLDFDRSIADHLRSHFEAQHDVDIGNDLAATQRLLRAAEQAKIEAGADGEAHVVIPFLAKAGTPLPRRLGFDERCTLEQLGQWTNDLIAQTLIICDEVLVEAGLVASEIDEVVLVGGMTRFPPVRYRVAAHFGAQAHTGLNPDEVVAAGAAMLGDALVRPSENVQLVDVLPVSIGMTVNYGPYETILHRNTRIPVTFERDLPTTVDGQTGLAIRLYQGESPNPVDNTWLGELVVTGIEPRPAGEIAVRLRLDLDDNGLLSVHAEEATTGQQLEQRFETTPPVEVAQVTAPPRTASAEASAPAEEPAPPVAEVVADAETPAEHAPAPETASPPQPPAAETAPETAPVTAPAETSAPAEEPAPPVAEVVADAETPAEHAPAPETASPPQPPAAETAPETAPADTSASAEEPAPPVAEVVADAETPAQSAPAPETASLPQPPAAETAAAAAPETAPAEPGTEAAADQTHRERAAEAQQALTAIQAAATALEALDRELRRLGGDPEIVWSGYAQLQRQIDAFRTTPAPDSNLTGDELAQFMDRVQHLQREWHELEPALRKAIAAQQAANHARMTQLRDDLQRRLSTLETRVLQATLPDDEQRDRFRQTLEQRIDEARQATEHALRGEALAAIEAAARQFALTEEALEATLRELVDHVAEQQQRRRAAATERLAALRSRLEACLSAIDTLEADARAAAPDAQSASEFEQRILLLRDDTLQPGGQLARAAEDPTDADLDTIDQAITAVEQGIEHVRADVQEALDVQQRQQVEALQSRLQDILTQIESERGLLRDRLARARGLADGAADDVADSLKQLEDADRRAAQAVQKLRRMLEALAAPDTPVDVAETEAQAEAFLSRVQTLHRATDGLVEQIESRLRESQKKEKRKPRKGALGRITLKRVRSGTDEDGSHDDKSPAEPDASSGGSPAVDDDLFEAQAPAPAETPTASSTGYQDITQLLTIETPEPDQDADDVEALFFTEDDFDNGPDEVIELTAPPETTEPEPTNSAVADVIDSDEHLDPDAFATDLVARGIVTAAQLAEAEARRTDRLPGFRDFAVAQGHLDKTKAELIEREQAQLERQYDYKSFAETAVYLGLMREDEVAAIERDRLRSGPSLEELFIELGYIEPATLEQERQRFLQQQSASSLQQLPLPDGLKRPALVRLVTGITQKHAAQLAGLQLAPDVRTDGGAEAFAGAHFQIHGEVDATAIVHADYAATYLLATALNPALGMVDDVDPELLREQFAIFVQQVAEETGTRLAQVRGNMSASAAEAGDAAPQGETTVRIGLESPRGTIELTWNE